jgi:hypothetical protein
MMYKELAANLQDRARARANALRSVTFQEAAAAVLYERGVFQSGDFGRGYEAYIGVVPFRDDSRGTLNTGDGINVQACDIDSANAMCIVSTRSREVLGWITPAREWADAYCIGAGHAGGRGVRLIEAGYDLGLEFQPQRFMYAR